MAQTLRFTGFGSCGSLWLQGNEKPRTSRGVIGVRLFRREIDSDYSSSPVFPFRVLYSCQSRFHGFRLPDRLLSSDYSDLRRIIDIQE